MGKEDIAYEYGRLQDELLRSSLSEEELEYLGKDVIFTVYEHLGQIFVIVDDEADGDLKDFGENFQKEMIRQILESWEKEKSKIKKEEI